MFITTYFLKQMKTEHRKYWVFQTQTNVNEAIQINLDTVVSFIRFKLTFQHVRRVSKSKNC